MVTNSAEVVAVIMSISAVVKAASVVTEVVTLVPSLRVVDDSRDPVVLFGCNK